MLAKIRSLVLFLLLVPNISQALIISGGMGLGSTEMTNETTDKEGPLTQAFTVERLFHSKLSVGVEHLRSMTTKLVTSAAFTGLVGRYYVNAAPVKLYKPEELSTEMTMSRDIAVFYGVGFGYGQSSRLPNDVGLSSNAAGLYLSPRGGVDYQMTRNIGVRGELIYAMTIVGKGSLKQMSLGGAVYWMF